MPTLLLIAVLLPLAGALALLVRPNLGYKSARLVALGTVLATLVLGLGLLLGFEKGKATPQFSPTHLELRPGGEVAEYGATWIRVGNSSIRFALGLDGISVLLFVLTSVLMIPSVFASWESVRERAAPHYALMLALQTGLLGLFASLDVVLFYIFFEFTLIPLFFLIGLYGGPDRQRASVTFFLYTLAGSLLTLLGVIALVVVHSQHAGYLTFSIPELTDGLARMSWAGWSAAATTHWTSLQALIFLLLFAGFAIKVPLFPFHTWLPLAHVEAPTAGSILLAGVLLKVGSYGFLRFNLAMTPHGAVFWMPMLATLAIIGIIYGALTALAQSDVKKLVAYSSVSHMGFIALGLFTLTATGVEGAVVQMINHGLTTGALFACVGVLYERYHTREMDEVGGLWMRLPLLAFFFIMAALGSAAVPGLNGFVGEFPILLGSFARSPKYGVWAAVGMILGAYYLLLMLRKVIFGPLHEPGHGGGDHGQGAGHAGPMVRPVGWHEIAGLSTLVVLIIAIGVYPAPLMERIAPSVRPIVARFPVPTTTASAEGVAQQATPAADLARRTPDQDRAR